MIGIETSGLTFPCISARGHYRDSSDVSYCYYCGLIVEEWKKKKLTRRQRGLPSRGTLKIVQLAERDGWDCHYCGFTLNEQTATRDHIVPISEGGHKKKIKNQVLACGPCNNKKGSKDYETWRTQSTWLQKRRTWVTMMKSGIIPSRPAGTKNFMEDMHGVSLELDGAQG